MIEQMLKYNILLFHLEFEKFLESLQEKGLLDMALSEIKVQENNDKEFKYGTMADVLIKQLKEWKKINEKDYKGYVPENNSLITEKGEEFAEWIKGLFDREKLIEQEIITIKKAEEKDSIWGEFNSDLLDKIKNSELKFVFCSCTESAFTEDIEKQYPVALVNKVSGIAYFVLFGDIDNKDFNYYQETGPLNTSSYWVAEKEKLNEEKLLCKQQLYFAYSNIEILEKARDVWFTKLNYNKAKINTRSEAENSLKIVEGYLPLKNKTEFEGFLNEQGVFFEVCTYRQMQDNDREKVPVLLKNNAFARLFEPITLLFSLPAYRELDLTPLFAPFFMMFFGFCMGDAGYGLLFVAIGLLLRRKVQPKMRPILDLVSWLGLAAVIFGTLSGTIFGYSLIECEALKNVKNMFFDQDKMMILSLVLGGIQILFGMFIKILNVIKQEGFKYSIGKIGWLCMIVGALPLLSPVLGMSPLPMFVNYISYSVIGLGFLGAFLYNNPDKSWWMNIGGGLWDSYNTATGLVGDLLSYIRLFALGLTGGILGSVFNDLAFQMSGSIPVVKQLVILLILLFGHSLNIALCALGAVVHPLRLTFVEFYKNAGFTGGGRAYEPFKIEK